MLSSERTGVAALAAIARRKTWQYLGTSSDLEILETLACREALALASDINVLASVYLNAVRNI
jgi:hypothetical protein